RSPSPISSPIHSTHPSTHDDLIARDQVVADTTRPKEEEVTRFDLCSNASSKSNEKPARIPSPIISPLLNKNKRSNRKKSKKKEKLMEKWMLKQGNELNELYVSEADCCNEIRGHAYECNGSQVMYDYDPNSRFDGIDDISVELGDTIIEEEIEGEEFSSITMPTIF
ncbi:hypothetical protein PMAYCL1PPCAC_23614, partial [Pristionchus mayeri]